jgi:hypothetical protein
MTIGFVFLEMADRIRCWMGVALEQSARPGDRRTTERKRPAVAADDSGVSQTRLTEAQLQRARKGE